MADTAPTRRAEEDKRLLRWQARLLPFMVGSLVTLGAIFFVASLWQYSRLQRYFDPPKVELREEIKRLEVGMPPTITQEYRDWYVRAVLEEMAMKRRYQQNSVVVQARLWTRLMGFLTGMVLVFSGCIFILGKLREDVNVSADVQGAKWTLITSSPGVVLALGGTALMALAIYVPATVESSDSAVYLPAYAITGPGGSTLTRPPAPMSPPIRSPADDVHADRPLPPDVDQLLKQEAAKGRPEPSK
jgi:ABC-type Fe3+-siderophore transport system permease subunit